VATPPPQTGTPSTPLPEIGTLSEQQVRGSACVHCGIHLDNGDAIDLGERPASRAGGRVSWFPRACPRCTSGPAENWPNLST
jgi:hypothetical protein